MAKNLITKNNLIKKALPEASLIYIFEDDLITPGAKDFIIQKKYKCKYIKKEELKEFIKKIMSEEIEIKNFDQNQISELIDQILKKAI